MFKMENVFKLELPQSKIWNVHQSVNQSINQPASEQKDFHIWDKAQPPRFSWQSLCVLVSVYVCLCVWVYWFDLPATTVSERCRRTRTCSISPTSVQAWRLRTLFRRIAINTLQISAWKERERGRESVRDGIREQSKQAKLYKAYQTLNSQGCVCVFLCVWAPERRSKKGFFPLPQANVLRNQRNNCDCCCCCCCNCSTVCPVQ